MVGCVRVLRGRQYGEAVGGEAGGQGGDADVEVDVPVFGKVGFDSLKDGGVNAGQAAIASGQRFLRRRRAEVVVKQRVQVARAEVGPAVRGGGHEGDRAGGPAAGAF